MCGSKLYSPRERGGNCFCKWTELSLSVPVSALRAAAAPEVMEEGEREGSPRGVDTGDCCCCCCCCCWCWSKRGTFRDKILFTVTFTPIPPSFIHKDEVKKHKFNIELNTSTTYMYIHEYFKHTTYQQVHGTLIASHWPNWTFERLCPSSPGRGCRRPAARRSSSRPPRR
jgi:hypothetical protein